MKLIMGSVVICTASFASANLLTNGSFEGANVPGWVNWGDQFSPSNVYNNTGANGFLLPSANGNFTGVVAQEGDQFVAVLRSSSFAGAITQQISAPLEVGQRYRVSGWLHQAVRSGIDVPGRYEVVFSADATVSNAISVGVFEPTVSVAEGWVERSFQFTATSNVASLGFLSFRGIQVPGQPFSYAALDNVSMTADPVPEPLTLGVLGIGGMLIARRRRMIR